MNQTNANKDIDQAVARPRLENEAIPAATIDPPPVHPTRKSPRISSPLPQFACELALAPALEYHLIKDIHDEKKIEKLEPPYQPNTTAPLIVLTKIEIEIEKGLQAVNETATIATDMNPAPTARIEIEIEPKTKTGIETEIEKKREMTALPVTTAAEQVEQSPLLPLPHPHTPRNRPETLRQSPLSPA
jgi:hypothetical protein